MIFYIYIAAVAFFYIGFIVFSIDIGYKSKRAGLKKHQYNSNISNIKFFTQVIILSAIPVVNIYFGLFYIFSKDLSKVTDEMIEKIKADQEKINK